MPVAGPDLLSERVTPNPARPPSSTGPEFPFAFTGGRSDFGLELRTLAGSPLAFSPSRQRGTAADARLRFAIFIFLSCGCSVATDMLLIRRWSLTVREESQRVRACLPLLARPLPVLDASALSQ